MSTRAAPWRRLSPSGCRRVRRMRSRRWRRPPPPRGARRPPPPPRGVPETDGALRTPFQRDRDRIVHSKAFRRLKHKTQVFVAPEGDHYRTRLTHTLEVTQISRTVARALGPNGALVEATGRAPAPAPPPFGHLGEAALDACVRDRYGGAF